MNEPIVEYLRYGTHPTQPSQHAHDWLELYLLLEGSCTYLINNKIYNVESGDLIIIPEHTIHLAQYSDNRRERILINLPFNYISHHIRSELYKLHSVYRCGDKLSEVKDIFFEIYNNYTLDDRFSTHLIKSNVSRLFALLLRNNNNQEYTLDPNHDDDIIPAVLAYISNNFSNDLTLHKLADTFYISSGHLSRIFKAHTGFCFSEYLGLYRIERAKELLNETNLSIKDVATKCGFPDSNYFTVKFKKETGSTPKEFRKSANK